MNAKSVFAGTGLWFGLWFVLVSVFASSSAKAQDDLPEFSATALTGDSVASDKLIGQPTLLILTPSRDAAKSTRVWIKALREEIDPSEYLIRDIISIDLPFFLSEQDALAKARDAVPERYHDQTWLMDSSLLEKTFDIPTDGTDACIVVLDQHGKVREYVYGDMTQRRLDLIEKTLSGI